MRDTLGQIDPGFAFECSDLCDMYDGPSKVVLKKSVRRVKVIRDTLTRVTAGWLWWKDEKIPERLILHTKLKLTGNSSRR